MKTIRRYHLQPNKLQTIQLPAGSEILSVQTKEDDAPILWALVDPAQPEEERTLSVYATGTEVPDDPGSYCGSFQLFGGSLEFHAFIEPSNESREG
ncbi:DUF7352 domain-containing protein [Desulfogranum mediterraneum]|uniref:DUF7352 domain-containing protein n=1 Tax=Desulfogranum mediterraneum TaxID=160661 RepID=UPI0012946A83|nr:hypothetical protein [Desulfogranum mediterraneum]